MILKIEQETSKSINLSFLKEQKKSRELDINKYSSLQEARLLMKSL
jgi:hypothetical protein